MPKISHPRFNEVAKRFGMVANYTDKNHGYSDVRFTNETWEKIQPLFNGLNFRTVVKSTEKTTDKKPAKKGKYTYISPNGLDFVVSDSDKLELFSPVGENKIMRVWTLADKVALQALYARRRDEKRKRPIPESRGKVIK